MNDIKEIMARAVVVELIIKRKIKVSLEDAMATAQLQLDKLKEDGFVIVPIEPDNAMQLAANDQYGLESDVRDEVCRIYKAMIEAAQGGDV